MGDDYRGPDRRRGASSMDLLEHRINEIEKRATKLEEFMEEVRERLYTGARWASFWGALAGTVAVLGPLVGLYLAFR